jgi:hypothetical protein
MTFTITREQVYLIIIFVLLAVQFFQWRSIYKIKDQIDQIWTQMAMLVASMGKEIKDLEQRVNDIRK